MPKITNTEKLTPIALQDGTVIAPRETVEVDDNVWKDAEKRANIAAHVDSGSLVVGEKAAKKVEKADDEAKKDEPAEPQRTGAPGAPPAAPKR